jgi:hypothetical protein
MQSKKAIFPLLVVVCFLASFGCTPTKRAGQQKAQPETEQSSPSKNEQVESPKIKQTEIANPADNQKADSGEADSNQESVAELIATRTITHSIANTGVKSSVLLACMNANPDVDEKLRHNFKVVGEMDGVSVYRDENSGLLLIFTEPKDDLLLIQLSMPLAKFLKQRKDGSFDTEGAVAFERCVKRLGFAIDPSWQGKLSGWFASKIPVALITEDGASLKYKHLLISLETEEMAKKEPFITLSIGIPEKK